MKENTFITSSTEETKEVAEKIAREFLNKMTGKRAAVLSLRGDLGAGKTTFVQGFAKGLGIKEKILSPTFVILKKFKIAEIKNQKSKIKNFESFYHIDCYRLKGRKDLEILGFKKILLDPKNIIAIEWPERIKGLLPKDVISIKFRHLKEDKRSLLIKR